ncbi:hypothetical protein AX16_010954 [Volvariella volvacea WC 439]|nr:hypothetical protein AX16_010954 [Volvariella volvacea WC 439]
MNEEGTINERSLSSYDAAATTTATPIPTYSEPNPPKVAILLQKDILTRKGANAPVALQEDRQRIVAKAGGLRAVNMASMSLIIAEGTIN